MNEIIEASKTIGVITAVLKTNTISCILHQAGNQQNIKIDLEITWYCKNKRKDKDNIMAGTVYPRWSCSRRNTK